MDWLVTIQVRQSGAIGMYGIKTFECIAPHEDWALQAARNQAYALNLDVGMPYSVRIKDVDGVWKTYRDPTGRKLYRGVLSTPRVLT